MDYYHKYLKYKSKYLYEKKEDIEEKSLYDRLGGIFVISALVDDFSDAVMESPLVGRASKNPALREWSNREAERLPGLKFMRTLWVAEITGGPYKFEATVPGKCHLSLEKAHEKLHISPDEFDEVANILKKSLEKFKVPEIEKNKVLGAFAAHKVEVTKGYFDKINKPIDPNLICPEKNN